MYVCGPTVYGHSHIGHAKSYLSFDVIVRYLQYLGYKVRYVQNITDVGHLTDDADEGEDKIEKQSRIDKVHPMELVDQYIRSYFEDMDALGNLRPNISPRATGHILEQIELVKTLIAKGFAYEVNGSAYFDVHKFPDYGKLSGRNIEDLEAGKRVEVRHEKRHPADFALWKKAEPGHILRWNSPWGEGYPGWHVECSVMSMKYLGTTFDIHGGGIENQFPHHESEIAQSVAATGKPFVKYWVHNNMVTVDGQKMGKSLGNVIALKDTFKKYDPLVVRFFILQSHYRSTLDFSEEALKAADEGLVKLHNTIRNLREEIATSRGSREIKLSLDSYKARFLEAMNDDFNTPQAIAVLFDLSKEVNALLSSGEKFDPRSLQKIDDFYLELGGEKILGIIPASTDHLLLPKLKTTTKEITGIARPVSLLDDELIQFLVDLRTEIRANKLWALSDKIRDELNKLGVIIEDKKEGTVWKKGR